MRIRRFAGAVTAGLALTLLQVTPAVAAAGDLDTSFSSNGKEKVDAASGGEDVAIQSNGKIVAVGSDGTKMVVVRLTTNGSLDTSFSGDGVLHVGFGEDGESEASGVALVGSDIVVVGTHFPESSTGDVTMAVARIDSDGNLDDSFSGNGKELFGLSGDTRGADVAIQSNGRIVCVGRDGHDLLVVRFKSDGTPDSSFDGDGSATTSFSDAVEGMAVAVDPGTQEILAGATHVVSGSTEDFVIARYTTTGALDNTWSDDGKRTAQTTSDGGLQSLVVDASSRVVAVGSTESASHGFQFVVRRFDNDGTSDDAWSGDGVVQAGFKRGGESADDFGFDVALQSNGKVVVAGTSLDGDREFAVMRFSTDGHLDHGFGGGDGAVLTSFNQQAGANALDIDDSNGRIVVVGNAIQDDLSGDGMYLARYLGS
jgi:uncharacterized delta-60 repeat protein